MGLAVLVVIYFVRYSLWLFDVNSLTITDRWDLAALNVLVFSSFLLLLRRSPVSSIDQWRTRGVYVAFFAALFSEMYGFALTAYFLSSIGVTTTARPTPLLEISGPYVIDLGTFVASIATGLGLGLVAAGWREVYRSKTLATHGVYRVVRHPQYLGILLITAAWLFSWPTILMILMWPILAYSYYKLAKREEAYLEKEFGDAFRDYAKRVSMFLPYL